jgi:hypothetical protein
MVGTDLTQAVPLTAAAAIGAVIFGHVEFGITTSLIIGSVPAVLIGSLISSTVPDRVVRPVIAFVIFASGLKYIGLDTTTLGWALVATLALAGIAWAVVARPWQTVASPPESSASPPESSASPPDSRASPPEPAATLVD